MFDIRKNVNIRAEIPVMYINFNIGENIVKHVHTNL